ncbi:MAG: Uncharacterized protein MJ1295, partial [uncultured Thermomicrobiales bacterium]
GDRARHDPRFPFAHLSLRWRTLAGRADPARGRGRLRDAGDHRPLRHRRSRADPRDAAGGSRRGARRLAGDRGLHRRGTDPSAARGHPERGVSRARTRRGDRQCPRRDPGRADRARHQRRRRALRVGRSPRPPRPDHRGRCGGGAGARRLPRTDLRARPLADERPCRQDSVGGRGASVGQQRCPHPTGTPQRRDGPPDRARSGADRRPGGANAAAQPRAADRAAARALGQSADSL